MCTGCKHSNYLWFDKKESADGTILLSFNRPPYGINMHNVCNVESHLPENIRAKAPKGRQTKAKHML